MTKTWEEVRAEMDVYYNSRQFKIDKMIYRMRRLVTSPLRWKNTIKHWYQRAKRGYSDRDAWSGDWYIAAQIAGIMKIIVEKGHGVAMSYANDDNTPIDVMVERRNNEWRHYAAIFEEYANNGPAHNEEWQKEFGGVLDETMQDALQWLSQHFQELWD